MATNRADTLDPALLRQGRLDRKIEFPHPGRKSIINDLLCLNIPNLTQLQLSLSQLRATSR